MEPELIGDGRIVRLLGVTLDHLHGLKRELALSRGLDQPEIGVRERA